MTGDVVERPISSLAVTIDALLERLDSLVAENQDLRKQLLVQSELAETFSDKNSRASQAIQRLIARMEGACNDR